MEKASKGSRQREAILQCIIQNVKAKGYPPSIREIGEAVGLKSTATVYTHLTRLEREGSIKRDPTKPRAITILRQ